MTKKQNARLVMSWKLNYRFQKVDKCNFENQNAETSKQKEWFLEGGA